MALQQADSTYAFIEKKIRHLTASASESALSSADIQQYVNNFYNWDFPYAIKIDQQRIVYKFLTIPNVDRYPVDVNSYQGFRAPVYFEGIQGNFFKNRDQLYNLYPRYPAIFQPAAGDGVTTTFNFNLVGSTLNPYPQPSGGILSTQVVIGGIDINGNPIRVIDDGGAVVDADGVGSNTTAGRLLYIQQNNVGNNIYLNTTKGNQLTQTALSEVAADGSNIYTQDVIFTLRGTYPNAAIVPGTLQFYFDFGGPNQTLYQDNGYGVVAAISGPYTITSGQINYGTSVVTLNFSNPPPLATAAQANFRYFTTATDVMQQPAIPPLSPLGGGNTYYNPSYPAYPPIAPTPQYIGTVNYITTDISITFPVPPAAGTNITVWAAQYQPGRPYNLLFWNNEFTIRPVPDKVYLVEVEAYQTPVQFMQTTDNPLINQWAQYIAYGAACEILRDRQDMEGVENLLEGLRRQEGLVLERQAVEEVQIPNITMFNTTNTGYGYGAGTGYGVGF